MEWYFALLIGILIGFPAGVLFRDAWTMFRDAAKEYNDETETAVKNNGMRGRAVLWTVVIFFSLIQIALGAGVVVAVRGAGDTQDCLVNLAEAQNSTRNAWSAWLLDLEKLVKLENPNPEDSRNEFLGSSKTIRGELAEDNKQADECLAKVEKDGWSPTGY